MEALTIVGLLIYIAYKEYHTAKERKDLLRAIMSKNLTEYTASEIIKKEVVEQKPPDLVPVEQASDKEFDKLIKQQLNTDKPVDTSIKQKLAKALFKKNAK